MTTVKHKKAKWHYCSPHSFGTRAKKVAGTTASAVAASAAGRSVVFYASDRVIYIRHIAACNCDSLVLLEMIVLSVVVLLEARVEFVVLLEVWVDLELGLELVVFVGATTEGSRGASDMVVVKDEVLSCVVVW